MAIYEQYSSRTAFVKLTRCIGGGDTRETLVLRPRGRLEDLMNAMKKLIVPTLCVLLGCAGGAAVGSVTAQTWPEPVVTHPWQQECITPTGMSPRSRNDFLRDELRIRGEHGWELVGEVLGQVCFKRPAS